MSVSHISDSASPACFLLLLLLSSQDAKYVLSHRRLLSFGFGEAHKAPPASPAAAAAAFVVYLRRPLAQHSRLNYCLHLICCLNTKLLSASYFLPPPRHRPEDVRGASIRI